MKYLTSWTIYIAADMLDWVGNTLKVQSALEASVVLFRKSEAIQGKGKGPWA